jgi:hypothetical protein
LTFQVGNGEARLLSHERLNMICPPSVGERPQAGRSGGFWMELRDSGGRVLFHRLLSSTLAGSVEVHSPDGSIRREFGSAEDTIVEVLLPDEPDATSVVLMGDYLDARIATAGRAAGARELARFDVPVGEKGRQ